MAAQPRAAPRSPGQPRVAPPCPAWDSGSRRAYRAQRERDRSGECSAVLSSAAGRGDEKKFPEAMNSGGMFEDGRAADTRIQAMLVLPIESATQQRHWSTMSLVPSTPPNNSHVLLAPLTKLTYFWRLCAPRELYG